MSFAMRIGPAMLLVVGLFACRARAENQGQADLDKATEIRLSVTTLTDLGEVIRLTESALKKGLDEDNSLLATQLLASTRIQRGLNLTQMIFESSTPDPRWSQFRQLALSDLDQALELDPTQPSAWLAVARLNLLPGGDSKRAMAALDRTIQLDDVEPSLHARALLFRSQLVEEPDKKMADLDRAARIDPTNASVLRTRATLLADQQKQDEALADFDAALELDPDHAPTLLDRAVLLLELERFDEAIAGFDRAHELVPDSAVPLLRRGQALGLQMKFDEALETLDAAYAIDPGNLGTLLLRASVLQELDQSDRALADVDRILELEPGLAMAIQLRVRLLAGSGKFDEVVTQLESLRQSEPEDIDVALQLAVFYSVEQQPRKAIEICTQILAEHPDNGLALLARADSQLAIGRHAPAIDDFEKALKLLPDESSLLNNFAWVLATSPNDKLRDGKRAIELATMACELTKYKLPHILSTLAAAYAESGDFKTAIQWSEKATKLGDEDQKEQLAKELESYHQQKPWRERQTTPEDSTKPTPKIDSKPTPKSRPDRDPAA